MLQHPLLYLAVRQTLNGIRRALTSARRAIGLVFIVSYYILVFRPFASGSEGSGNLALPFLTLPPKEVLNAFLFGGFALMSILLLGSLTSYRGGHRPADIDVLFPTPLSPRLVLGFRMLRDSALNLLLPLILVLISWRSTSTTWATLIQGVDPGAAQTSLRLVTVSYLLMAACWVALGYAISLYVHRPGEKYDRIRKMTHVGIVLVLLVVVGSLGWSLKQNIESEGILRAMQHPVVRGVLFLPNSAVDFTLAPITGDWTSGLIGLAVLIACLVLSINLALNQSSWLYEIAAQRVSATVQTVELARKGDTTALLAEMARSGRMKSKRLAWLQRWRPTGVWGLVWKDLVVSLRGYTAILLMFPILGVALIVMIWFTTQDRPQARQLVNVVGFFLGLMTFASVTTVAQAGFIDLLNRVDTLKPLPFSPGKIFFFEVSGKAIAGIVTALVMGIVSLILFPGEFLSLIAWVLLSCAATVLISATVGLTTILFPDIDDPSQRGFRGLVQVLALVIFAIPPIGLFLSLRIGAQWNPMAAVVPAAAVCVGLAVLLSFQAGKLFATYNPSE